jgi:hypothetical protein
LSVFDVRKAIYFSTVYQSIMRTSIRDPNNNSPKRILVPDLHAAEYLKSKFPGSTIEHLDIGIEETLSKMPGRPRRYWTNAERVAEQRKRAKEKRLRLMSNLFSLKNCQDALMNGWGNGTGNSPRCRAENTIEPYRVLSTPPQVIFERLKTIFVSDFRDQPCAGTMYPDKYESTPSQYVRWWDADTFAGMLFGLHQRKVPNKESCYLLSPAVFDPDQCKGKDRGRNNIVYLQNLWLDFEHGDLKPEEFANLFPHTRMITTNTFHHTAENPRFRVIIPTTQPVTPDVYEALFDQIALKLEDARYAVNRPKRGRKKKIDANKPKSGLDWTKRSATSLFYLPCQAEDPEQSFFDYYDHPERLPLDPVPWIENSQVPIQPELHSDWFNSNPATGKEIDEARVQRARAEWRRTPKGHGNDAFFRLALECKHAGMNLSQIESLLREELKYSHSPNEREAQISNILTSLKTGPQA